MRLLRGSRRLAQAGGVLALWLLAGCDQFRFQGVKDPCPSEPRLTGDKIQSCTGNQNTVLESRPPSEVSRAVEQLQGEPLRILGRPLRHVIALDYSGSMYGGYGKPAVATDLDCGSAVDPEGNTIRTYFWQKEGFARLLREGVLGRLEQNDPVHPLVFNRDAVLLEEPGHSRLYRGETRLAQPPKALHGVEEVANRLTAFPSGSLPGNPFHAEFEAPGAANESRLNLALDAASAIFESTSDRDGILWIVTDNIIENTPQGTSDGMIDQDARNNRAFYERLKENPRWQVVYAWPIHRAPWLCGSTLIVYGLYYSSRERITSPLYNDLTAGETARLSHPSQVEVFKDYASDKSPAPGWAFKLKPENLDVVQLKFVGQVKCPPREVGQRLECQAKVQVTNLLRHRKVDSAVITLQSGRTDPWGRAGKQQVPVRTAVPFCVGQIRSRNLKIPDTIGPSASVTFPVTLDIPPVETQVRNVADLWENAKFDQFRMVGRVGVSIQDLHTSMAIQEADLSGIYGIKDLPEIFRNPDTDNLNTSICLVMQVNNPNFKFSILVLILGALGIGTVLFGGWLAKPKYHTVEIEGDSRGSLRLTRLGWSPVLLDGSELAKARLRLGGAARVKGSNGYRIFHRGGYWDVQSGEDFTESKRLRLVPGKPRKGKTRRSDDF